MSYYDNETHRKEIDILLVNIAKINANLGIDSTDLERAEIREKIRTEENKIKAIDPKYWKDVFEID